MPEGWYFDGPTPTTCQACQDNNHEEHHPIFSVTVEGLEGEFGYFSCDCACTPESEQYALARIQEMLDDGNGGDYD